MASPIDDDFDFGDLADLDLDADEKAMLAQDYKAQGILLPHQPPKTNMINRSQAQSSKGFSNKNSVNQSISSFFKPKQVMPQTNNVALNNIVKPSVTNDEFEEFGNLDDSALLEDLTEDTISTSTAPTRSNFFTENNNVRTPQQQQPYQQQQQKPQNQHPISMSTAQGVSNPTQPTKLFSIFSGAKNQLNNNNSINNNSRSSVTLNTGNRDHGILLGAGLGSVVNNEGLSVSSDSSTSARSGNNPYNNSNNNPYSNAGSNPYNNSRNNSFNSNNTNSSSNRNVNNGFATLRKTNPNNNNNRNNTVIIPRSDPTNDFAADIFRSPELPVQSPQKQTHHIVDERAILTWQYPINYPKRDYQYNIIRRALFTNTLVSLPTGLGKTFIAAVVMLNYFRWFPKSKIVFMAPTRPLVNQQIEACFNICGIPQEATIELTGQHNPTLREQAWKEKRVFFCTPQILNNDLKSGLCPAAELVCLVVDEAHRATGNYAYAQVIRELEPINRDVRILALSATPGSDIKAVQKVVTNLKIAKIESRTEDSMDLQAYVFKRNITETVVPCGREISEIRDRFARMMRPYLERIMKHGVIRTADPAQLSRFAILQGKNAYLQDNRGNSSIKNLVVRTSLIAMSLVAAYELLCVYGIWPFFVHMDPYSNSRDIMGDQDVDGGSRLPEGGRGGTGSKQYNNQDDEEEGEFKVSLARKAMMDNPDFMRMMDQVRTKVNSPNFVSHPKMERLVAVVIKHFMDHQDKHDSLQNSSFSTIDNENTPTETRVMIFANFRETVDEIDRVLEKHRPLIKVRRFIGQATAKGKKGISQKEQQKVVADFQKGEYNVLVATSIGEEGLDIGDVDLIVCYDSHSSPIRMLQRMGRTGRKRSGRICLLLAEGQEEAKYRKSQAAYKQVQRAITQGNSLVYYPDNPKILPGGQPPACDFVNITVPTYVASSGRKRRRQAENNEPVLQSNRLRSAYLDPQEHAQFQQRYRLPKRQIWRITFEKACATALRKKKTTMIPDKTSVVGHSTRTLTYIKSINQLAKARVEQSIRPYTDSESDSYTKRMLRLLELSKSLHKDIDQDQDSDSVGRSKSLKKTALSRSKNSDVYSHESLDENEMEKLEHRMGHAKRSRASRFKRVIYSDSEQEGTIFDDDDDDNDQGKSRLHVKDRRPKIMPKSRRKKDTKSGNEAKPAIDNMENKSTTSSAPRSIKSYFQTISDDEVDREIMGGLDEVFGIPEEYHYSRERTMSPLPQDNLVPAHEQGSGAQKGFDFRETSMSPAYWYQPTEDERYNPDQDWQEGEDEESLELGDTHTFTIFDIPPVPKAGEWYEPDQVIMSFGDSQREIDASRILSPIKKATQIAPVMENAKSKVSKSNRLWGDTSSDESNHGFGFGDLVLTDDDYLPDLDDEDLWE
ncbi:3'-5' DNA helicase [Linnemannia zychae]|nr:3'-5' DNA helicase [Linnemannia zychae]